MKSLSCAVVCSVLLAACVTAPPTPLMNTQTVTVTKEVPVPCIDPAMIPQPSQPLKSDNDLLAGSGSQVADNLWIDHKVRSDWDSDLLIEVTACSKLPQPATVK